MNKQKLYFIPGLMCDERLWSRMVPYLENDYEIVYLKIPNTTSFDEKCEILNEQIKEENSTLIGFSLGGYTSLYFSLKYPNKVGKIFTIAASGSVMSENEIQRRRAAMIAFRDVDFCPPPREKICTLIDENSYNDEEIFKLVEEMFMDLGRDIYETQMESAFARTNLKEEITKSTKPLNMIYGNRDRLVDDKWIIELQNNRTENLNILCIDTTSHNIPLDFPKECVQFIKEN